MSEPAPQVPTDLAAYATVAECEAYALRVADVTAWTAASADAKGRALLQASDEIDACRFMGWPYGDYVARYEGTQKRAFPRVSPDDPALWPRGKQMASGQIWDLDPVTHLVIVPLRVKMACFYQAMEILRDPIRRDRLRDRDQGVTAQSAGRGVSENYDPARAIHHVCMEARLQLAPFLLKSGRLC